MLCYAYEYVHIKKYEQKKCIVKFRYNYNNSVSAIYVYIFSVQPCTVQKLLIVNMLREAISIPWHTPFIFLFQFCKCDLM